MQGIDDNSNRLNHNVLMNFFIIRNRYVILSAILILIKCTSNFTVRKELKSNMDIRNEQFSRFKT